MKDNKHNYTPYLLFSFRQNMNRHGFISDTGKKLKADGKEHEFNIIFKGKKEKAFYEAKIDYFNKNYPILIGNYGNNRGKRHSCVISIQKLIIYN